MVSQSVGIVMSAYTLPCAIRCAELAARRESAALRERMKGRLMDLASVAATASFLGFLGTVVGMLNSFRSIGGSRTMILVDVTHRISVAMIPGAIGLLVAVLAFWSYQYLSDQLQAIELEMQSATAELVNRLLLYLQALKTTDPALWSALSRKPDTRAVNIYTSGNVEPPQLITDRIYRNGLLELIWPHLGSDFDKESIVDAAVWLCFAYGAAGYLAYWIQNRSLAGVVVLSFFAAAALAIKGHAVRGVIYIFAFLSNAVVFCLLSPYALEPGTFLCALATLPLLGVLKAIYGTEIGTKSISARVAQGLLPLFFIAACAVVLFGTFLGLYRVQAGDSSMSPTILPGDWLVGMNLSPADPVFRTELLEVSAGSVGTLRVVGLPGDRVQIKAGQLILNGVPVREPYAKPYSGLGDFPLPSDAYPDGYLRWTHARAYGDALSVTDAYVVPEGRYFMLNDDRKQLGDSRSMGPLPRGYVMAKLMLAYSRKQFPLRSPRLLH